MTQFMEFVSQKKNCEFSSYKELHQFSVSHSPEFWTLLIEYFAPIYSGSLEPVKAQESFLDYPWFPHVRLNFAENLLRHGNKTKVALNFQHESGTQIKWTYQDLVKKTSQLAQLLQNHMGEGDVLAAYMPNLPHTVVGMLAASSFGGVFTSTSCDFGVEGVVDRFGQSTPKVLLAVKGYEYNGKYFDLTQKVREVCQRVPQIKFVVWVDFLKKAHPDEKLDLPISSMTWEEIETLPQKSLNFHRLPFSSPLYIMYSSGTTGKPKCIVHSVGGTLLQHIKELGLHSDLREDKKIFYFTTCGWMMWNWLVSSLYFGAEIVLYEGSPGRPNLSHFVEMIDREGIHIFGTSPKFLRALEVDNYEATSNFPTLETILSTGAPLLPEQFDYVYQKIKRDVQLSSISGGTDIIGCFMLGNPLFPVKRGEIQCLGLGMDVAALDEQGKVVVDKEGELVCLRPFPSQPIGFLNDPDKELFKKAYFSVFPQIWHHGDFITVTPEGSVIVHGRSDATLNPGGVRIGTAEIYRQTEQLPYIEDALCVGHQKKGEVYIHLFVKMRAGEQLTQERKSEIKKKIKDNTTPRHVPEQVWPISDIPYTRSGKKMELAVTRILAGRALTYLEAVANPECLKEFEEIKRKL